MYCRHFGFREDPFGVSPDPRFYWNSAQHAEAGASLYYAIAQRRGFAVLVAPPGLGKTTVLVKLAEKIAAEARVAFFVHPRFEAGSILESVLLAMGLDPARDTVQRQRQLRLFLLDLYHKGQTCVIVFDEAQNLAADSLETIRMLSNFETPRARLVQFVLAGQPELARLLAAPGCEQIRQRVNVVARLDPLPPAEVEQYISHRLSAAGAARVPFSSAALRAIAAASAGVPRNVNTLCFNALTLAYSQGRREVSASDVAEVARELAFEANPLPPPAAPTLAHVEPGSARPWLLAAAVLVLTLVCGGAALVAK